MNTIGDRIGELIESLGMKKVRFAERLKIDQSYVTQLTSGKRNPSDRTISDMCREFNVNEEWLRNGNGEMFLDISEDEFARVAASLSKDVLVRNLIVGYWKLDDDSKNLFLEFVRRLSVNIKGLSTPATADSTSEKTPFDSTDITPIDFSKLSIDEKVELYRRELEREEKARAKSKALQKNA